MKYNDTATSRSISSEDSHKWLKPCRSAHLKKRLANTTPIETSNKFSSLMNNSTPTVHAIRNLNDSNIQDDLPLTKKLSQTTKNFDDSIIFNISEKQLSPSEKSVLKKGLNFCPEPPGYNKLKLMDDLFWFCRNLRLREFFHENIETATNNNNTIYNKTHERTDMSKQFKNHSFHPPLDHCDKLNQYISSIKNGIINLCNKKYINHQQNITFDEKLAIKNLKANQNIIIHSADKRGKIVIMNRNEYKGECKKQLSDSTFYKQTDESNLQKQNTKLRNEIMNLKANNYISEKEYKFLSKHFHSSRTPVSYGLPKMHKFFEKFPPLRPIVSGFNCISASLSEYVDSSLKYLAKTC